MKQHNIQRIVLLTLVLALISTAPLWASKRIYVGNLPFSQQLGVDMPVQEVELGASTNATILDTDKFAEMCARSTDPRFAAQIDGVRFAKGDPVTVIFTVSEKFELLFPSQGLKAKLHFVEKDGDFQAIVDWLGSLEAK